MEDSILGGVYDKSVAGQSNPAQQNQDQMRQSIQQTIVVSKQDSSKMWYFFEVN